MIIAEMANGRPLFAGTSETDQLGKFFRLLGTPSINGHPLIVDLPEYSLDLLPRYQQPGNGIDSLVPALDSSGVDLLNQMLQAI